ncbi:hypothetical protein FPF71_06740 [Algibacter amylolyticus]|uniref:SGNH/GDSL hydrolase family protein n=1 Tax=Algibacter amylolyticus TaxID=1608400 RepID=A0A5M7B885_9FLAO|nr:hypothetical protein [Algibacter amylolyticus]KAA5825599.1 hypothetical protein F2B50_06740 [Algibacter amylolyticus]MBB5268175.1 hypothetical protein [Algibacter amylolyticus]TSJ79897.1 hypothetical protein FPF71_06740 [Algibacter amylolyticus]
MKQFIKGLFFFIFPILALFIILEILVRDSNSLYKEKWKEYTAKADSIEILVLGNSHAMNGIDPREFDLFTYNMAFGSQTIYFDKAITLKQIKKMPNLKYVLVSIDYHSLYYTHNKARDIFYHYYYKIDYNKKNYFIEDLSWVYALGFKQTIREHLQRGKTNSYNGFVPHNTTNWSVINTPSAEKRVEQLEAGFREKNNIINNLNEFIKTLKKEKITPILITLPCHKYFNENLNKDIVNKNLVEINKISDFYDVPYWNLTNKKYPDSLFYNVDHLNIHGAKKISKELNIKIQGLNNVL